MTCVPRGAGRVWLITACLFALCPGAARAAAAQRPQPEKQTEAQDDSRDICYYCESARPAAVSRSSSPRRAKPRAKAARRYVRVTPRLPSPARTPKSEGRRTEAAPAYEELGVTLWRYRRSGPGDDEGVRIFDEDADSDLTPVRINADGALSIGDRIQLSVESSRPGYLYVIDREQYGGGRTSEPYLIFPSRSTPDGDNRVRAGKLIYLPAMSKRKPYFTLRELEPESKVRITGELLTVIVSPTPLQLPALGQSRTLLPVEKVRQWEKGWEAAFERLEVEGGAGQTRTREEKEAGGDEARILDQDDPAPQTIYRVRVKPGNPLLVTIPLQCGGSPVP